MQAAFSTGNSVKKQPALSHVVLFNQPSRILVNWLIKTAKFLYNTALILFTKIT
ncbi:hypothetical protein HMPREF0476_1408 [Kingella kingae ATCC 23330]|uniref:Uncharacterized protein n=1 Tax=Kingella kingae ATCC 23330 TaxID=887327 RepID=F5S875_KINKI|nr:hypothetical protein HMPREF0476_1408 [Kingella kingae ATCC 23330]